MVKWPILIHIAMAIWLVITAYHIVRDAARNRNNGREEWELEEGLPP